MTTQLQSQPSVVENASLWFGILAGPAAWLLSHQVEYCLVPYLCHGGSRAVLYFWGALFLLLCVAGALVSLSKWHFNRAGRDEAMENRPAFMAALGLTNSLLFALIIIGQFIAIAMVDPCQD